MQRKFQSRYLASDIPVDASKAEVTVWKTGGQRKTHNYLEVKLTWRKDCTSQPSSQKGLVIDQMLVSGTSIETVLNLLKCP